jgi:hypothetical protein
MFNQILETDIKCRIRMRCECHSLLANDILWLPILIAHGIFDLRRMISTLLKRVKLTNCTNMHVDNHSISFHPTDSGRNYH